MPRETITSLRAKLAAKERALDAALDYQRQLEKRAHLADAIKTGSADALNMVLMDIAMHVIPQAELDAIACPTAGQIIHAAKQANIAREAIVETSLTAAGELALDCSGRDVVECIEVMQEKIRDLSTQVDDLQNSRVEPETVKELLADIGLDTYPLTQYPIGDPMLAQALKVRR